MGHTDGLHRWLQDPAHGRPSTPPINLSIFHCSRDTEVNVIVSKSRSPSRASRVFFLSCLPVRSLAPLSPSPPLPPVGLRTFAFAGSALPAPARPGGAGKPAGSLRDELSLNQLRGRRRLAGKGVLVGLSTLIVN